ncbi:mechanosensitive ion channel family protein [Mechercharimyces sp. CAU 1602]|uniref:mechanosensitive ion channel family protein n=1 Tax=Mechercharimyces sp. CAU 1602 TaxID=2973933 RepID=UPI002161A5FB|nr:mechanosensitive ion channel family protein [Mechercharimyces sp. CAU 1602]MCS1351740.1 mechanosensitive ion channel family protein [Mechercharimyces sp. CAU 1602]
MNLSSIIIPYIQFTLISITLLLMYVLTQKYLKRSIRKNLLYKETSPAGQQYISTLSTSIVRFVFLYLIAFSLLSLWGMDIWASLLSLAIIASMCTLIVGLGTRGLLTDLIMGYFITQEDQIRVGDYVSVGTYSGIVENIGRRIVKIRGFSGDIHLIPYRKLDTVTNHSRGNMRALIDISIAPTSDINHVIHILQSTCDKAKTDTPQIIEGPDVLGVQKLSSSEMVIRILARTQNMAQWTVERELRKCLKEALDEAGIPIGCQSPSAMYPNDQQQQPPAH